MYPATHKFNVRVLTCLIQRHIITLFKPLKTLNERNTTLSKCIFLFESKCKRRAIQTILSLKGYREFIFPERKG